MKMGGVYLIYKGPAVQRNHTNSEEKLSRVERVKLK